MSEATIEPDTKDWTWVLDRPCPECGFDASAVTVDRIPAVIRDNATTWEAVLTARRRGHPARAEHLVAARVRRATSATSTASSTSGSG